ncbi:uncharacterized protein BO72DRAFT_494379 [Aspergillus fijiensis CBS 313.89]|uniref:Uncharacterized protein n=1 Tax=Aspergillus fijiensis CBS 313.89 TaxID=1448319 RepID=A0A8G1RV63_9EURO|nr:uncharacterized protein BO72DRAFT_494379 [Aspergillus fijiensis CBS 313.89]RAK79528.1 hypothetical protein BO72DRAFT_494379 [Aspergillus fijiensis CBS 313.89]
MAESKEDIVADNRPQSYIQGARLHLTTAALALYLFLTILEIPIVTIALISITEELGGLNKIY